MSALIAVTGATGLVGRAVLSELASPALNVRAVVRTVNAVSAAQDSNITYIALGELSSHTDWLAAWTA